MVHKVRKYIDCLVLGKTIINYVNKLYSLPSCSNPATQGHAYVYIYTSNLFIFTYILYNLYVICTGLLAKMYSLNFQNFNKKKKENQQTYNNFIPQKFNIKYNNYSKLVCVCVCGGGGGRERVYWNHFFRWFICP